MNDTDALQVLAKYCADLGYEVPCDYLPDTCNYCDNNCEDKIEGGPNADCWMKYARMNALHTKMVSANIITHSKDVPDTNVGKICEVKHSIDELIDELEGIFSNIREKNVDDSVCGLCEHDCDYGIDGCANECPGFERDDCFKLKDDIRKEWRENYG